MYQRHFRKALRILALCSEIIPYGHPSELRNDMECNKRLVAFDQIRNDAVIALQNYNTGSHKIAKCFYGVKVR